MSQKLDFNGFGSEITRQVCIPTNFFEQLLPEVEDRDELCLLLLIFDALSSAENGAIKIDPMQMSEDPQVMVNFGGDAQRFQTALRLSVEANALIEVSQVEDKNFYLLNTSENQTLVENIRSGKIKAQDVGTVYQMVDKPNIYQLYEENIGLLTPLVAEMLKADEKEYPVEWIRDAIHIAVERNARSWKYVRAILSAWQKEGRDGKNKQTPESIRKKYQDSWLGKDGGK